MPLFGLVNEANHQREAQFLLIRSCKVEQLSMGLMVRTPTFQRMLAVLAESYFRDSSHFVIFSSCSLIIVSSSSWYPTWVFSNCFRWAVISSEYETL